MDDQARLTAFWQRYLATLPEDTPRPNTLPEAWYFCDNAADANELGELVRNGTKQATCSLLWAYEDEGESVPQVGELSIITNWDGDPLCIVETTEVTIQPFNTVGAQFAYDEGEGDRSLVYWREVHWTVFTRECVTLGRTPADDMPVVCERFRLVFVA